MSCWNLFVRSVVILSVELSSSESSTCVASTEVSITRTNQVLCHVARSCQNWECAVMNLRKFIGNFLLLLAVLSLGAWMGLHTSIRWTSVEYIACRAVWEGTWHKEYRVRREVKSMWYLQHILWWLNLVTVSIGFSHSQFSSNCTKREKIQMVMHLWVCGSLQGDYYYSKKETGIGRQHRYW